MEKRREQPRLAKGWSTGYDLSACDLEFLEGLLEASPGPELKEAIHAEIQRRRTLPPDLRWRRSPT